MAVAEIRHMLDDVPLQPDDIDLRVLDKLWSRADEQALFESATRGPAHSVQSRYVPMLDVEGDDADLFQQVMK
jgi:hypothetical protein